MTLISAKGLDAKTFFKKGNPSAQGSSFDLSIGKIYDEDGVEILDHYTLKPGHMVQVVSAEVFDLPRNITGHVTYKTGLTRIGVWALTVGIVDPGWNGPIATTLLNFSKVGHTVHIGDKFLRVSLFKHALVNKGVTREAAALPEYLKEIKSLAASKFPATFLNSNEIANDAGNKVLKKIRTEALAWVALIALVFSAIQISAPIASKYVENKISPTEAHQLKDEIEALKEQLKEIHEMAIRTSENEDK